MTDLYEDVPRLASMRSRVRLGPAFLIYFHIVICCVSLVYVSRWYADFHILFNAHQLYQATFGVAALSLISILFAAADFSFGYFVGFYLYTMTLGFVWLSFFSLFNYDQVLARFSAAASLLAFLLPVLLITSPIPPVYTMSAKTFARLPLFILLLSALVIVIGSGYGFRVVGLTEMYKFRAEVVYPTGMNYLIGITSNALLPFSFACFVARGERWRAMACLLLLLLFYPITLNKLSLFTPAWLVFVTVLSKLFEERTAVVLSLLLPIVSGVLLASLFGTAVISYFGTVNFRMIALPSSAMDVYNDFFSRHELTHFCQISVLRPLGCPYEQPLSIVMANEYHLGNFNASLFATEGVASVGLQFAPISMLICGLVLALGNRMSAGLPPSFVLISSAVLPQVFLNVPLSIILLTHGAACLFMLWYATPRNLEI
ncbi:hypothetical protein SAMN05443247_04679 [Bradyrhizobium erythrophlei]|nr:hypothetical protein SAMN05443247_04679 [Bradyrhizobium erythrophlei]